jgi:hypothetical protein
MASKKHKPQKSGAVWHLSAEEATLAGKPRYNGFACGHGAHGDAKYNRAKSKRAWRNELNREGIRKGPLFFVWDQALVPLCQQGRFRLTQFCVSRDRSAVARRSPLSNP